MIKSTKKKRPQISLGMHLNVKQLSDNTSYVRNTFLVIKRSIPDAVEFEKSLATAAGEKLKDHCIYSVSSLENTSAAIYIWVVNDVMVFGFTLTVIKQQVGDIGDGAATIPDTSSVTSTTFRGNHMWAFTDLFEIRRGGSFVEVENRLHHDGGVWDERSDVVIYSIENSDKTNIMAAFGKYSIRFGMFKFPKKNKKDYVDDIYP